MSSPEQRLERLFTPSSPTDPTTASFPYIDFSNDPIIPLPGLASRTLMYCFPLHADYDRLAAVCHQRLNFSPLSQTTRYVPISSQVVLVLSHLQKSYTLDKAYKRAGLIQETAAQVFIPVIEWKRNHRDEWVAQRILAFIPYIFVDSPITYAIGREHIGFPKNMGQFRYPESPQQADSFEVSAYGFQRFDDQNPQFPGYHPWLSIQKTADVPGAPAGNWTNHRDAWAGVNKSIDLTPSDSLFPKNLGFYLHELGDLFRREVPMIFLQQFRDITDPQRACYQSINEAPGRVQAIHGGWFLPGKFDVTFHNMASFPIKSDLGLPDTATVTDAFWVDTDLVFETGQTLWKAP